MREAIRIHAPALTGFAAMLLIALIMGTTIQAALPNAPPTLAGLPKQPIELPGPMQDQDGDSYADSVDRMDGNLAIRLEVDALRSKGDLPYLMVGTQDDHWRLGAGQELDWPHIVDSDPLGYRVGSAAWKDHALRTGAWWSSIPEEGAKKTIAPMDTLAPDTDVEGVTWPQSFWLDVRDDRDAWDLTLELYDAGPDPDRLEATWTVTVDRGGFWAVKDLQTPLGERMDFGARPGVGLNVSIQADIATPVASEVAQRWAPTYHFAAEEAFFPVPGELLQKFHGIASSTADYRTWTREFTNGRDAYVLWLADYNGDRTTDHLDAALMVDLLQAGGLTPPTIYSRVHMTTADQVVVQYWSIYAYNFVRDEGGDDVPVLAHSGDREFLQLTFDSLEAALGGDTATACFSQHYHGICVPIEGAPEVFVARGSHASYPAPGDDRRLRPTFAGFGDIFDGDGSTWEPGNYTLEELTNQPWHAGYLWGPVTRHSRDLGTASKPLLQHTFRYPFIDPIAWQSTQRQATLEEASELYGGSE